VSSAPPGDRPDAELGSGDGTATDPPGTALGSPVPAVHACLSDPGRLVGVVRVGAIFSDGH
jgi:hypothetical protein